MKIKCLGTLIYMKTQVPENGLHAGVRCASFHTMISTDLKRE